MTSCGSRRGALLMELIASIAIFVVGGLAILATMRQATDGVLRARERERACSLARSAMSAIEAGIVRADALDGEVARWPDGWILGGTPGGWDEAGGAFPDELPTPTGWAIEVHSEASEFAGLDLVSVRAYRDGGEGRSGGTSYTLHQLVRTGARFATPGAGGGSP